MISGPCKWKKQGYLIYFYYSLLYLCSILKPYFLILHFLGKLWLSIVQNVTVWFKLRNHMWFKLKNGACMYAKSSGFILCLYPTLRVTGGVFCFQVWDLTKAPLHPDLLHLPTWIYQMRSSWKTLFVIYHC